MICLYCEKELFGRQKSYCSDRCRKAFVRAQRGHGRGHTGVDDSDCPRLSRGATINYCERTGALFVWREGRDGSTIHEGLTDSSRERLMRLIGETNPIYGWEGGEVTWRLSAK